MGQFFNQLTTMQQSLANLSLKAHEHGFHQHSADFINFSTRIEKLNGDLQMYFHDHDRLIRELTKEKK